jgi:hypothetical protein
MPNVVNHTANAFWMRGFSDGCKLVSSAQDNVCGFENLTGDIIGSGIDADFYVIVNSSAIDAYIPVYGVLCDVDVNDGLIPKLAFLYLNTNFF